MNKITHLIILIFSIQLSVKAQITLSENDLPKIGDSQVSVKVDNELAITLNQGDRGENTTWNFSYLSGTEKDTIIWIDASTTSNYSQFPLSTLALNKECISYHSHVTHKDEISCKNEFFVKNASGLFLYGSDAELISKYDIPLLVFPILNYGDSITTSSRIAYSQNDATTKVLHTYGYSKADAWGTITTPAGTAEVIRVFTYETIFDSTYTNGSGSLTGKTEGNFSYKWYTKGLGYPVLEISKTANTQNAKYAASLSSITTDIEKVYLNKQTAIVYPNPVKNQAILKLHDDFSNESYVLNISDISGKILKTISLEGNEIIIDAGSFQQGTYFYEINSRIATVNGKFIVIK